MNEDSLNLQGLGLSEALRKLSSFLARHSIEHAETDARMLLLGAAGLSRSDLIMSPDRPLDTAVAERLEAFVERRIAGEPATRILGERSFWTLRLHVTPAVLDPRPDSETIVAAALEALGERRRDPLRILDLGVGSGALLLALLSECPRATGVGVDLSPQACAVAAENAAANGLADRARIVSGRWGDALGERFDLVVSNPPYIETAVIADLATEVRAHDPMLALDGGADGLAAYRDIIAQLPELMNPEAIVVLELGAGQSADVTEIARRAGLGALGSRKDLGGIDRALVLAGGLEKESA